MFLKSDPERPEVDVDRFLEHFVTQFGTFVVPQIDQKLKQNFAQNKTKKEPTKTDTIHTNIVYKEVRIEPKEIAIPYEVKIFKTDTIFREKLESDTLISSVIINKRKTIILFTIIIFFGFIKSN